MNRETFLTLCQNSSQGTYEAFRELLAKMEDPSSRVHAVTFGHELAKFLTENHSSTEMLQRYHFSFSNLTFQQQDGNKTQLILLQLPSTFAPEQWSFTFYEGLARYKPSEFQDRTIAELGCGVGWITLALAKQTKPTKIYGLDINPKAILCSKINLFLNAFDEQGKPSWLHEDKTLVDTVEFHQSDLLEYCRNKKLFIDRVIGCIPQVLNPDPEFASRLMGRRGLEKGLEQALEQANDEFLYSLSNYTADQGYLEDQFGLGLIARAVEESVDVLRVSGKIILNLGSRPGTGVLNRLFQRRGFVVKQVWRTQVNQAKDTDIHGLVSIEEKTSHRFEFFMDSGSEIPISAKTALAYADAGGKIAHGLAVYEAQLRDPIHLPKIIQFMRQGDRKSARDSIDLSYSEDALALEKTSFLSALIDQTQESNGLFPYEETSGLRKFRDHISTFFRQYFNIPLNHANLIILPSRTSACETVLETYKPKKILLDSQLATSLGNRPELLEAPRSSDLLCELIEKLCPEVVIYSILSAEAETRESFLRICTTAEKAASRVFIDISELIELSSTPRSNGIFRYLAKNPLPQHVSLICGLVKNRIYRDLEVCFLVSQNQNLLENLEYSAELTYSRAPVLTQLYYDKIFQDLISFQITHTQSDTPQNSFSLKPELEPSNHKYISLPPATRLAFSHPAISGESLARNPELIRLDYGENCFPSPQSLQRALFEAFVKMNLSSEECECAQEVRQVVQRRFRIENHETADVILGCGVAPLFSRIAAHCAKSGATLAFPMGAYGHFMASSLYYGAKIEIIQSEKSNLFKLDSRALEETLQKSQSPTWVILSAPLVNPTGARYSGAELDALAQVVEKHKGVLILDSVFCGLDFEPPGSNDLPDLSKYPSLRWAILGGLSKEFAAGGLRIGYAVTTDPSIHSVFKKNQPLSPHSTLRFTLKNVYKDLLRGDPKLLSELQAQREELNLRATRLSAVLRQTGWDPLPSSGGLFLSATPLVQLNIDELADRFREKVGVVINPPHWTGIPGYFRFVLSTSPAHFQEALTRIQNSGKLAF